MMADEMTKQNGEHDQEEQDSRKENRPEDNTERDQSPTPAPRRSVRVSKKPKYLGDYHCSAVS